MKRFACLIFVSIALLVSLSSSVRAVEGKFHEAPYVRVYFSPSGGCTKAIVEEIDRAQSEILVQAYSFTSAPIADALLQASKRGVNVAVILDKAQRTQRYSSATFFRNRGIPTFIDDRHAIAHNKVIIINRDTVITGSFNFTKAAEERNAENLLVIHSRGIARDYAENWQNHRGHSEKYM